MQRIPGVFGRPMASVVGFKIVDKGWPTFIDLIGASTGCVSASHLSPD